MLQRTNAKATHEIFFSPRALYVLVWDMGANNQLAERPMMNIMRVLLRRYIQVILSSKQTLL